MLKELLKSNLNKNTKKLISSIENSKPEDLIKLYLRSIDLQKAASARKQPMNFFNRSEQTLEEFIVTTEGEKILEAKKLNMWMLAHIWVNAKSKYEYNLKNQSNGERFLEIEAKKLTKDSLHKFVEACLHYRQRKFTHELFELIQQQENKLLKKTKHLITQTQI